LKRTLIRETTFEKESLAGEKDYVSGTNERIIEEGMVMSKATETSVRGGPGGGGK